MWQKEFLLPDQPILWQVFTRFQYELNPVKPQDISESDGNWKIQVWITHQEKPRKSPKGKKCKSLVSSRQAHWKQNGEQLTSKKLWIKIKHILSKWMSYVIIRNMFLRPFCTRLFIDLKTYFTSSDYSAGPWHFDESRVILS